MGVNFDIDEYISQIRRQLNESNEETKKYVSEKVRELIEKYKISKEDER